MTQAIIQLSNISKYYRLYRHDFDRAKEVFTGKDHHQKHYALRNINIDVRHGEVVGVIGKNGAGKSTLLKILADTLQPSEGTMRVEGRVAALLELGASFHPEMTGHENIYLNCSIQGLSKQETDAIYHDIVAFSGVEEFIHRPVKTYSSGMFVRLAFAIATHIDPDILIIDEALSVGDGAFARKSFDRIMDFKRAGKTIFFCSHSLYQVEALCDRVLWIHDGCVRAEGAPANVVTEYGEFLRMEAPRAENMEAEVVADEASDEVAPVPRTGSATPRIVDIKVSVDGHRARAHKVLSGHSTLDIEVSFDPGRDLPLASVAIAFTGGDGRILASMGTVNDGIALKVDDNGLGIARVRLPNFPLLKGNYNIDVYLMCEQGMHIYEAVVQAAELNVEQKGLARGLVDLPHTWLP
jgi:lipopolysaccharide transport system ATP-binding protein